VWTYGMVASQTRCDINANGTLTHCSRTPAGPGGSGYAAVSSGGNRSCALTAAGDIHCWGDAFLGDGSLNDDYVPSLVAGGHVFRDVSVGTSHSCGVAVDGKAWCWGENFNGQLGFGSATTHSATPVAVTSPVASPTTTHAFVEAGLGAFHSCAIAAGRADIFCWGNNNQFRLGTGTYPNEYSPTRVIVF